MRYFWNVSASSTLGIKVLVEEQAISTLVEFFCRRVRRGRDKTRFRFFCALVLDDEKWSLSARNTRCSIRCTKCWCACGECGKVKSGDECLSVFVVGRMPYIRWGYAKSDTRLQYNIRNSAPSWMAVSVC